MDVVEPLSSNGVPTDTEAGTPSPLPEERTADGLDAIELEPVLEVVAAVRGRSARRGPGAVAPAHARRWSGSAGSWRGWARWRGSSAGATGCWPNRCPTCRARSHGSGSRGACSRARTSSPFVRVLGSAAAGARAISDGSQENGAARRRARPRRCPDKAIERRLEQSLDADGSLLDTASPALAAARREVQHARQRLLRRLDTLLRGLDSTAAPSDASVTVRGGRYVIPVRRDSRSRPAGIVHDESGSAGTLFVEPTEAIELGNALREAEVEEERETLRVLRELTGLLRPELPALRGAVEMCVAVDDLVARARYAVAVEGEVPEVVPAPSALRIVNGRHPLLLAGSEPVVPFDLEMDPAERTLLISGPNTGGKTVLLKAVGLASAMAQSGIVPPVGAGSRLPAFGGFFADIGDRQSIAASLSTFSAHVRDAAPHPGGGGRRLAGAAGRGRQRHRPGGRGGARRRHPRLAHRARRAHARYHAPRRAQGPGEPHAGCGQRLAPVRRRDAHPHLSLRQRRARPLLRSGHRAAPGHRARDPRRRGGAGARRGAQPGHAARRGGGARAGVRETQARLEQREAELDALQARLAAQDERQRAPRGGAQAVGEGRRPGGPERRRGST